MGDGIIPTKGITPGSSLSWRPSSSSCRESNPEDYLAEIIQRQSPDVISFGDEEFRPTDRSLMSPHQSVTIWFAEHVLPILARQGYRDLVVEFFPDDPQLNQEIQTYIQTGHEPSEGSRLEEIIRRQEEPGIRTLLDSARKLGITIHGGRGTWDDWVHQGINLPEVIHKVAEAVRRTTLKKIHEIRSQGRKVATWNGYLHNDPMPYKKHFFASFGREVNREMPGKYLAIDLFFKDTVNRRGDFVPANGWIPELAQWLRPYARRNPLQAECLKRLPHSYVFLLPGTAR